ncbi:MAG: 4-hydroxy-tetrahydrodipicolinate reductase [Candidatus Diapherotrites archaeon]|nr:4-hydroxy-tetrahydrodipicolinate reductase [Candidatus Diapherotrites archaeon]
MNVALIGFGKMGREIKELADERKITVSSIIDPVAKEANFKEISKESLKDVDVCIDFTTPDVVIDNIKRVASLGKDIVVGTTGWYNEIDKVRKIALDHNIGLIYASNFSLGVNIFYKIIKDASKLINKFEDYDVLAYEIHHKMKKDSPSGTAKSISDILVKNFSKKKKVVYTMLDRAICPDEFHFASVRGGFVPGTHTVIFDSFADSIELSHIARTRRGFAAGALIAAEWIRGKKGFYNFSDIFDEIIEGYS